MRSVRKRRAIWWCCGIMLAVAAGAFLARGPWEDYARERKQRDEAIAEMREVEAERTALQRERVETGGESGRERIARESGWVKPDERRLGTGE